MISPSFSLVVNTPHALDQSPRPASNIDRVKELIELFATDSDSHIVDQDHKGYLTQAYEIIQAAEGNQMNSPSYSYACSKQAIIIMLSITKGIDNENLGEFSEQEEPSQLFLKFLEHYSSSDKASKDMCISVFHVARHMIKNTNSNAQKNTCPNPRCMAKECSKDETIRNEIIREFLKEDQILNEALKELFNDGLPFVLNGPPQPLPHPNPRPSRPKPILNEQPEKGCCTIS